MPKAAKLDLPALWERVRLALRQKPCGGKELCELLRISQPALSLLIKAHRQELFVAGKTKKAVYALPRELQGLPVPLEVYRIDGTGKGARAGTLTAVYPNESFYWEEAGGKGSRFYPGLPYFLEDLRPGGYLGALLPRLHPELGAPGDVTKWSTEQALRYLARFGSDLIGDFILGDEAYARFLDKLERTAGVAPGDRPEQYDKAAEDVIALGDPGSSAGGEQPKFLATKKPQTKVIVKFSPRKEDARARRQADLLVCEGMALSVLGEAGFGVAKWELLESRQRTFLEMERFDRVGNGGRLGLVSMRALDLEFVGAGEGWVVVGESLRRQGRISKEDMESIRRLDLFGALIANTDRHLGNLSFYVGAQGELRLAPVYDMLPMAYFPKVEVAPRDFTPPKPSPSLAEAWRSMLPVAIQFWLQVAGDKRVTEEFRATARENAGRLEKLRGQVERLPG